MAKEQLLSITVKKKEDISEWYTQVITKADLIDYSKVSGCIIYKPLSYSIWEVIKDETDKRFKKIGLKNAYFPLFIPESLLMKEAEHLEGFAPEVAWVTHSGDSELGERLAIRPTSETIMYDSYSKWIRSYRDLPLRLNQWNNVVRWEFKHSTPFLRSREFLWNEGHTVFADKKSAEAEGDDILNIYGEILRDYMAIHPVLGKKSKNETFPGAEYTYSYECFLETGRAIQGPDFHHDGQIFAKAFDIKFTNKEGKQEYVYQNTFAITTRMLGVLIMTHSDDKGLVLPPKLATDKVVIVPLLFKGKEENVLQKANELKDQLSEFGVILDDDEKESAGFKFNKWEIRGMPVRIEIGPKDIENNKVIVTRRDTLEKYEVPISNIKAGIGDILESMQSDMYEKSKKFVEDRVKVCENVKEFEKAFKEECWPLTKWCGEPECEDKIKEKYGAKSNNIPKEQPKKAEGSCAFCSNKAKYYGFICKSF